MTARSYTIVALGDSTTAGTPGFRSPLEAPPAGDGDIRSQYAYWLMRTHRDWRVLNRGVNGERTEQIRARVDRDVREARPDLVIVLAGVNDVYQGRSASDVTRGLARLLDDIRVAAPGAPIVACSILPYNTAAGEANRCMEMVNAWIRERAATDSWLTFCDTRAAVSAPDDPDRLADSPDGLHPGVDGYRLLALALEPSVKRALLR
jgi:lysophospholipase L1-like esterase